MLLISEVEPPSLLQCTLAIRTVTRFNADGSPLPEKNGASIRTRTSGLASSLTAVVKTCFRVQCAQVTKYAADIRSRTSDFTYSRSVIEKTCWQVSCARINFTRKMLLMPKVVSFVMPESQSRRPVMGLNVVGSPSAGIMFLISAVIPCLLEVPLLPVAISQGIVGGILRCIMNLAKRGRKVLLGST